MGKWAMYRRRGGGGVAGAAGGTAPPVFAANWQAVPVPADSFQLIFLTTDDQPTDTLNGQYRLNHGAWVDAGTFSDGAPVTIGDFAALDVVEVRAQWWVDGVSPPPLSDWGAPVQVQP